MLEPLGFRVLIQPEEDVNEDGKTEGGIFIPEEVRKLQKRTTHVGVIRAIGPTAWKAFDDGRHWASVGDKVVYVKYGGKIITDPVTSQEYVLLADEDVLCKVSGETDD